MSDVPYPQLRNDASKPFDYEDRLKKLQLVLDYNEAELVRCKETIQHTQKLLEDIEALLNSRRGLNE